ncbi:MAG: transglycosylase SLT domain-containing protein [Rhodospirillales bacterium]|nr:transglycosylase SLT domain-containing protein [Rhodospirillales bacterium]
MLLMLMAFAFAQAMQAAHGALPPLSNPTRSLCAQAIRSQERARSIPRHLLAAIALAETGRWDSANKVSFAWPWTVMAEGQGQFLPSKAAAIATVRELQERGVRNIDVGCMQINLRYHPDAFASLEQAFDPSANAAYAATYLADLFKETGSWESAVARYHSATPEYAGPYREKVKRLWAQVRNTDVAPAESSPTREIAVAAIDHDRMARFKEARSRDTGPRRSFLSSRRPQTNVPLRDASAQASFADNRRQKLEEWRAFVRRLRSATTVASLP